MILVIKPANVSLRYNNHYYTKEALLVLYTE